MHVTDRIGYRTEEAQNMSYPKISFVKTITYAQITI
jgi:hypothetical protein